MAGGGGRWAGDRMCRWVGAAHSHGPSSCTGQGLNEGQVAGGTTADGRALNSRLGSTPNTHGNRWGVRGNPSHGDVKPDAYTFPFRGRDGVTSGSRGP